jgi:hypothetical protein
VTTKLTLISNDHPDEDVFENYLFHRLGDEVAAKLEEHLLICEKCGDALSQTEEYVRLMRAGTAAYVAENGNPRGAGSVREHGLRWNAAAAAILLLTCLTGLLSWRTPAGEPKLVELTAYRGVASQAPAGQPLDLKIDLTDAPPASGYRVEVVDSTGRRIWFGGTPARLAKGLSRGVYWVRLSTETGEPVREFGLTVAAQ